MHAKLALFLLLAATLNSMTEGAAKTLIDFTSSEYSTNDWFEVSDTTRSVGKSLAVIHTQKTQQYQQGVFFTLLNPQPDGACFASRRTNVQWDISNGTTLAITLRAQGQNNQYSVILKSDPGTKYSFEYFFDVDVNSGDFGMVSMPLSGFKAYFRGKIIEDVPPLDLTNIQVFGLQIAGGVYNADKKQFGVSSLELKSLQLY